jgi:hypothetical protein
VNSSTQTIWVDGLDLVRELRLYLQALGPAVPTSLNYLRKIDAFLDAPEQVALTRQAEVLKRNAMTQHGCNSSPSGMPLLSVELSHGVLTLLLPKLPHPFEGQEAEREALILRRLRANGRENFVLNAGSLPDDSEALANCLPRPVIDQDESMREVEDIDLAHREEADKSKGSRRTWNYRVMRFKHGEESWQAVHEVYYEAGIPVGYSGEPAVILWGEEEDSCTPFSILDRMKEALLKPALTEEEFQGTK